jgi:hypothetical protein
LSQIGKVHVGKFDEMVFSQQLIFLDRCHVWTFGGLE